MNRHRFGQWKQRTIALFAKSIHQEAPFWFSLLVRFDAKRTVQNTGGCYGDVGGVRHFGGDRDVGIGTRGRSASTASTAVHRSTFRKGKGGAGDGGGRSGRGLRLMQRRRERSALVALITADTGPTKGRLIGATAEEDGGEGDAKLSRHRTVKDEVDGRVDESKQIQQFSEGRVHVVEELFACEREASFDCALS
jgi:hypothetical protein